MSLTTKYAWSATAISEIINDTASHIYKAWSHLLQWDHVSTLSPVMLQTYADTLAMFGAPCKNVIGFIDCTCQPKVFQGTAYTGHKKHHGFKFQARALPNDLIGHLTGPFMAPANDNTVLTESGLMDAMARYAIKPGSGPDDPPEQRFFQIYEDSAYGVSPHILSPYACVGDLSNGEHIWNMAMDSVWISVEHAFGCVLQDWPYLNAW